MEEKINETVCCVNYESEYYRQEKYIKKLYTENERYKKALLGLVLRMLGDDE